MLPTAVVISSPGGIHTLFSAFPEVTSEPPSLICVSSSLKVIFSPLSFPLFMQMSHLTAPYYSFYVSL